MPLNIAIQQDDRHMDQSKVASTSRSQNKRKELRNRGGSCVESEGKAGGGEGR